jgi:hypothetical protein
MGFQSTVNINYAFGVVGELIFDGPQRADSLIMNSSGTPNVIGYAFTKSATTNIAVVGGAITPGATAFAGILCNPKVYASRGTSGQPLAPSLVLPDNSQGEFVTMGTIVVNCVANATQTGAKIGDVVLYNLSASGIAVGAISALTPGVSIPAGWAAVPNAYVRDYPTTAAGLIAINLTN